VTDKQIKPPRDGNTERRILDAARTVFVQRGTAGARMQEIAEEAGVNQALLHYYFRSKDGLAAAVFREVAGRLIPTIARILGSDAPLEAKVDEFVHIYIDTVRQNPFVPGYIISEMHHHPERLSDMMTQATGTHPADIGKGFLGRLDAQLAERVAAGTLRHISAEQFFVNLIALCMYPFVARPLITAVLAQDADDFDRFLLQRREQLPAFILGALRP
jgi:AcrR family transcriptional regulator